MAKTGRKNEKQLFLTKKRQKNVIFQEKNLINAILRDILYEHQCYGWDFYIFITVKLKLECMEKRCVAPAVSLKMLKWSRDTAYRGEARRLKCAGSRSGRRQRVLYNIRRAKKTYIQNVRKRCFRRCGSLGRESHNGSGKR